MYQGYLGYGDTEVINVARLVKYAAEGGAPAGVRLRPYVGPYDDLAAALGDDDYRTPLLDGAPWYDPTNPDSAMFSGLLPLEVTGLDGSTRARTVIEALRDGGNAGPVRAATRVVGVTALAVAPGLAALDAGLTWLAGVLHPPCAGAPEACAGLPLSLFSAPPTYCDRLPNLDADPIVTQLVTAPWNYDGPRLSLLDLYDTYLAPVCGPVTVTAHVADPSALDPDYDSGMPEGTVAVLDLVDSSGTVHATSGYVAVYGEADVTLTATADPSPGFPADWQPVIHWSAPNTSPIYSPGAPGSPPPPPNPMDAYGGVLRVLSWVYTRQPYLTPDECLTDLRRSLRNVVTLSGPTITETLLDDDGEPWAARVEWTWAATDPGVYGDTHDLVRGLSVGDQGVSGVPLEVDAATTANTNLVAPAAPRWPATYTVGGITLGSSSGGFMGGGLGGSGSTTYGPGTRVLFKDQTDPRQNGIRVFQGFGLPWIRATDMDTWAETVGAVVHVNSGSNAGTYWASDAVGGGTLDTTALHFAASTPPVAGYDDSVTYRADGLQIADNVAVTAGATSCPLPVPPLVLCGDDPDLPVLLVPPAPPTLTDAGMVTVTGYVRRALQIPPEWSPEPGAALVFKITHLGTTDYRGIRLRLYPDPDPDFGVVDECAFEQELFVTYLEGGQTLTIDTANRRVTTTCSTGLDSDHERSMRGSYGGPFVFPELRCGYRYHLVIDVPSDQGDEGVSVDLAVVRRTS